MREHEAASNTSRGNFTLHLEFQEIDSTFLPWQINISVSFMAGNRLFFSFLFINRKKHNKSRRVISSGAFWGWIAVGGKQPTETLL